MKRIFSIAISLVLLIFSVFSVCATITDTERIYYIEELGFTIYTPLYDAATRNVNNLDISESEYEEMLDYFEADGIYYYGYCSLYAYYDFVTDIIIYGEESDLHSLATVSDNVLQKVNDHMKKGWEDSGVTVIKNEIYDSYNAKYILTHLTDNEGNYAINYYTVENYKSIDIVMWSYGGEPSTSAKTELVSIINSIEFDEPTGKEVYEETFTFSIAENGKLTPLGQSLIASAVIILIQVIVGIVLLIVFVNKAKKRRQVALSQAPSPESKFCIYCSTELTEKDLFCHRCGKSQVITQTTEDTDIS